MILQQKMQEHIAANKVPNPAESEEQHRDRIAEIYDERFCRMWEFYLLSGETMFRTGAQMVFQMQLSRIREATGLTRDYIFKTEEKYRKQEIGRE